MKLLSPIQELVLEFISSYIEANGYPPTRIEIAKNFGYKSVNSAEGHLKNMQKKGVIVINRRVARGISIVGQGYIEDQTGKVPDGWQLVPIEPTEDMVVNGFESKPDKLFTPDIDWEAYAAMSGCEQAAHRAKLCWEAMLAAAPKLERKA